MRTPLTPKEKKVVALLCRGYTNKEIAYELNNSIRTIESHRANVYDKWHINSLRELIEINSPPSIPPILIIVDSSGIINNTTNIVIGEL